MINIDNQKTGLKDRMKFKQKSSNRSLFVSNAIASHASFIQGDSKDVSVKAKSFNIGKRTLIDKPLVEPENSESKESVPAKSLKKPPPMLSKLKNASHTVKDFSDKVQQQEPKQVEMEV